MCKITKVNIVTTILTTIGIIAVGLSVFTVYKYIEPRTKINFQCDIEDYCEESIVDCSEDYKIKQEITYHNYYLIFRTLRVKTLIMKDDNSKEIFDNYNISKLNRVEESKLREEAIEELIKNEYEVTDLDNSSMRILVLSTENFSLDEYKIISECFENNKDTLLELPNYIAYGDISKFNLDQFLIDFYSYFPPTHSEIIS
ncbi:MAG: hypothetical protein AAGF07_03930 [Patescibacteria group bacterium]